MRVFRMNDVTAAVDGGFFTLETVKVRLAAASEAVVTNRTLVEVEKEQGSVPVSPRVPLQVGEAVVSIGTSCPEAGLNPAFQKGKVTSTCPSAPNARLVVSCTVHTVSCPVTWLPGLSEAAERDTA